jgi:hypothetical protein
VSRTGAEVEPGLTWPEQKRRRVTWGNRCRGSGGATDGSLRVVNLARLGNPNTNEIWRPVCYGNSSILVAI